MSVLLEICVDSVESALQAQQAGADRLELCENLIQGGVTPSLGKIEQVLKAVEIPVRVLIRPRAGDFAYSVLELDIIYRDIELISQTSVEGIVAGALDQKNEIPDSFLDSCQAISNGKALAFHRAFDLTLDPMRSAEKLTQHGFDTLLTSGQKQSAEEGAECLADLQVKFGDRINILAGGGIRSSNISRIHQHTKITQFHSSAKTLTNQVTSVSMGSSAVAEQVFGVDQSEITKMKTCLQSFA